MNFDKDTELCGAFRIRVVTPENKERPYFLEHAMSPIGNVSENVIWDLLAKAKVTIPQEIAEYLELCKIYKIEPKDALNFSFGRRSIGSYYNFGRMSIEWFKDRLNQERFIRAWVEGYKVEVKSK